MIIKIPILYPEQILSNNKGTNVELCIFMAKDPAFSDVTALPADCGQKPTLLFFC